jgi:hypothetical protein
MRIGIMVAATSPINEITAIFATRWGLQRSGEINRARPKEPVSKGVRAFTTIHTFMIASQITIFVQN